MTVKKEFWNFIKYVAPFVSILIWELSRRLINGIGLRYLFFDYNLGRAFPRGLPRRNVFAELCSV